MGDRLWLNVMPVIPLARSVPVLRRGRKHIVTDIHNHSTRGLLVMSAPGGVYVERDEYRVDLDDPQGLAYALRWLDTNHGGSWTLGSMRWADIVERHFRGLTPSADKLTIAEALVRVIDK